MSYLKRNFEAEEKKSQSGIFVVEDIESNSSTISASEVNYRTPTPPLLCKLRRARVRIKKLPQHVLKKYNIKCKNISKSLLLQPSRTSGRVKDKKVPGQYLSVHVNKPLEEIVNKKKRKYPHKTATPGTSLKDNNSKPNVKAIKFSHVSNRIEKDELKISQSCANLLNTTTNQVPITLIDRSTSRKRSLHERIASTRLINVNKSTTPTTSISSKENFSCSRTRIYKPIKAAKSLYNKAVQPNLHNYPDVVITKYDIPTDKSSTVCQRSSINSLINPVRSLDGKVSPLYYPRDNNYTRSSIPNTSRQHNITIQVPMPYNATVPYLSHIQRIQPSSAAFPISIIPAKNISSSNPNLIINPAAVVQNEVFFTSRISNQRTVAIQTIATPPHNSSAQNDPVMVDSSKVLVINQPSLGSDPLDMLISPTKNKNLTNRQTANENNADSDIETCFDSDSDFEVTDTEKGTDPVVIKRIIFHTKSVQTKFTCNGSICGLVDSEEFNLNCFYCYDIFPLHKWLEFKEHIKQKHHVEEKENLLDSDEDIDNTKSTKSKELLSKPILNEENSANEFYKKLPLEPRIIAQRSNKLLTHPKATKTSTNRNINPFNQSQESLSSTLLNVNSLNDDIISIGSDGCDIDLEGIDDVNEAVAKDVQQFKKSTNKINYLKNSASEISDVSKLLPPSLSHISIRKVDRVLPTQSTNDTNLLRSEKTFLKLPANSNIQTLARPDIKKFLDNGRTRYFVVKKILTLPKTDMVPNMNASKGMILTKSSGTENCKKSYNGSNKTVVNGMASNNENEDSVPKPTNGRGILFGVTNSMVVIEFLLKLKTFPELWRPQLKNNKSLNYNESIQKLCNHLNNRFDLNIQEFEMRLSIQRVKDWYCRMLKNIYEHNQNRSNTAEPYKHKFPLYFKILNQFLTSDVHYTKSLLLNSRPKWMVYKTGTPPPKPKTNPFSLEENISKEIQTKPKSPTTSLKTPALLTSSSLSIKPVDPTQTMEDSTTIDITMDSVIEFDADTLYEHESSGEEVLEEFDETIVSNKKIDQIEQPKKKRTKIYLGRFECDICQKAYKRRCDLNRHRTLHFPPKFECTVCLQKYYFRHSAERCSHLKLKKFEEDVKGDNPKGKRIWPKKLFKFKLICEICGASYRSIGSLITHKKDKHLNQRLKCVVCKFTALSNWRIVQHQKKRHIVEPGTVEEVAKKSRPRMDSKTPFSIEARQAFDWRREMRKKLKPGEKFFGCCKCRIIFNSRKEKVLHNKLEHPITETTVVCLLCLPTKLLLSNSNCARRHYTEIHKVPWDEIDALVKRTKPIVNILSKEEFQLLNTSENYKALLEELLKNRKIEPIEKEETLEDEAFKAVQNLPLSPNIKEQEREVTKVDVESTKEENVFVDGIIDHDYNYEEVYDESGREYMINNEHDYSEERGTNDENYEAYEAISDQSGNNQMYPYKDEVVHLPCDIEQNNNDKIDDQDENYEECLENTVDEFVEELVQTELVEECIVAEECLDEVMGEEGDENV